MTLFINCPLPLSSYIMFKKLNPRSNALRDAGIGGIGIT